MQIKSTAVLLNYTDTHVHVHIHRRARAFTLAAVVNYQVVEDNVRFNGLIGLFFVSVTHQRAETSVAGQTQARSHTETLSVVQIFASVADNSVAATSLCAGNDPSKLEED